MEFYATTNGPFATGDGLLLAEKLGATFVDIDKVQLHPTGFIDPAKRSSKHRILAPEAIRGSGGVLLNVNGRRFINELEKRNVVSEAILSQPDQRAYMILFEEGAKQLASSLSFYEMVGVIKKIETVEDVATYMSISDDVIRDELNLYADAAAGTRADTFGKTSFPFPINRLEGSALKGYIMEVEPVVHYCMGKNNKSRSITILINV